MQCVRLDREQRHVQRLLHSVRHEPMLEEHHHVTSLFQGLLGRPYQAVWNDGRHAAVRGDRQLEVVRQGGCRVIIFNGRQPHRGDHVQVVDLVLQSVRGHLGAVGGCTLGCAIGQLRHDRVESRVEILLRLWRCLLDPVVSVQVEEAWPKRCIADGFSWRPHVAVRDRGIVAVSRSLEHRAGEVAEQFPHRELIRLQFVRFTPLEESTQTACLHGRLFRVAEGQVVERAVVVHHQALGIARKPRQGPITGDDR